jgi:large subunit ribosomal protein L24
MAGLKLKKGDRVRVRAGKDRGKEGEIMRVLPKAGKVIVEGVNVAKKHQRTTRATMQGGIIDKDMPIPVSNVSIICPTDGPTRVGYRFETSTLADGAKVVEKIRVCKKCGGDL